MLMFGKKEKLILCILILLVVLPNVYARNFTIYNVSSPSQTYFTINGETGRVGIGTAHPQNKLDIIGNLNVTGTIYGNITGTWNGSSDYFTKSEVIAFNYWNDTFSTFNKTYADTLYYDLGNSYGYYNSTNPQTETDPYWTENQSSYYNTTDINDFSLSHWTDDLGDRGYTSVSNFTNDLGYFNNIANFTGTLTNNKFCIYNSSDGNIWCNSNLSASETDPFWAANYSLYNDSWSSTYNSTYALWAYNQTIPAMTYADTTFLRKDGDNGTGIYNFGGSWVDGGLTIQEGDLYAQTVYVYNISSLQVSNLNINGSLLPQAGYDDTFDVGSSSLRWRDLYLGGDIYSNGTIYGNITGTWNGSSDYFTKSEIIAFNYWNNTFATFNKTYADTLYSTIDEPLWAANYSLYNDTWSLIYNVTYDLKVGGSGTENYITMWNSSSSLNNSVIYQEGGNIGIGTIDPQGVLDVNGTLYAKQIITYENITASWFIGFFDWAIGADSVEYLSFNGSELEFNETKINKTINNTLNGTYVPYTGALHNLDLGSKNISASNLQADNLDAGTIKINGSGDSYVNGNLGLGLENPNSKLDVNGTTNIRGNLSIKDTVISIDANGDVSVW